MTPGMSPWSRRRLLAREPSSGRGLAVTLTDDAMVRSSTLSACDTHSCTPSETRPCGPALKVNLVLLGFRRRVLLEQRADRRVMVDPMDRLAEQLVHGQDDQTVLDGL